MLPPSNQTSCEKFWSNQDEVSTLHHVSPTECSWKPQVEWLEQLSEDSEKWYQVDWGRKPELKTPPSHAWDSWIFSARVSRSRLEGSPKLGTVHQTERALWDALLSGLKTGKGHPTSQSEGNSIFVFYLFVFLCKPPGSPAEMVWQRPWWLCKHLYNSGWKPLSMTKGTVPKVWGNSLLLFSSF